MKSKTPYRFMFAGGGTGGHLYPALSVAQQIRKIKPEAEILFVGTKNKIEARVVPEYEFNFRTIWISGFSRQFNLNNILFPLKLIVSLFQALVIAFKFKPRVAIGSGAYVSGPVIWASSVLGSKVVLLEQNSYPGLTNRLLEKKANEIHITFEESKKYFREKNKLFLSGNPIRIDLKVVDKTEARRNLGLEDKKKTILIVGGSGGARSLNHAIAKSLNRFQENGIQILWITGKAYYHEFKKYTDHNVRVVEYINDMSEPFSACDLIVARAGASTLSEVSMLGLPVLFVPSPNVAADHQYKNAKALVDNNAAELVQDKNVENELAEKIIQVINNETRLKELAENIKAYAKPNAVQEIAERIIHMAEIL